MGERRCVHDDPGHERVASAPSRASSGDAEADRQERRHLAGRRGGGIDPVVLARPVVRGVVVDDDARHAPEQVRMPRRDLADPIERAAVGYDEEVVVGVWLGVGPGGRRRAGSRTAAAVGRRRRAVARPPSASTRRQIARVEPSVSASGFSWPTASTRRAARIRSTTRPGRHPPTPRGRSSVSAARHGGDAASRLNARRWGG